MTRFTNSGRFQFAKGFKHPDSAYESLCDSIAEGELSPCEAKIESYRARVAGREVTRWAVTVES